jgi:hypothetical protein
MIQRVSDNDDKLFGSAALYALLLDAELKPLFYIQRVFIQLAKHTQNNFDIICIGDWNSYYNCIDSFGRLS